MIVPANTDQSIKGKIEDLMSGTKQVRNTTHQLQGIG